MYPMMYSLCIFAISAVNCWVNPEDIMSSAEMGQKNKVGIFAKTSQLGRVILEQIKTSGDGVSLSLQQGGYSAAYSNRKILSLVSIYLRLFIDASSNNIDKAELDKNIFSKLMKHLHDIQEGDYFVEIVIDMKNTWQYLEMLHQEVRLVDQKISSLADLLRQLEFLTDPGLKDTNADTKRYLLSTIVTELRSIMMPEERKLNRDKQQKMTMLSRHLVALVKLNCHLKNKDKVIDELKNLANNFIKIHQKGYKTEIHPIFQEILVSTARISTDAGDNDEIIDNLRKKIEVVKDLFPNKSDVFMTEDVSMVLTKALRLLRIPEMEGGIPLDLPLRDQTMETINEVTEMLLDANTGPAFPARDGMYQKAAVAADTEQCSLIGA